MKVKSVKLNLAILALLILGGCASNNKFASRKYTKGYYVDFVSKQKAESGITRNENTTKQTIQVKQEPKAIVPIELVNNGNTSLKRPHPVGGKRHFSEPLVVAKKSRTNNIPVFEKSLFANSITTPPQDSTNTSKSYRKALALVLIGLGIAEIVLVMFLATTILPGVPGGLLVFFGALLLLVKYKPKPAIPASDIHSTTNPVYDPRQKGNTIAGVIFAAIGSALFLMGLLSTIFPGPGAIIVLGGLLILIGASLIFAHSSDNPPVEQIDKKIVPPVQNEVDTNSTPQYASLYFALSLIGLIALIVAVFTAASGLYEGAILVLLTVTAILALISCLIGFFGGIYSLGNKEEKKKDLAISAIIFSILAFAFIYYIATHDIGP